MRASCYLAALVAILVPSAVFAAACDGFVDVDSANTTYCPAVTYLKSKGITLGCDGTHYCPNDPVSRLQMALFLQRMGRGDSTNSLGDPGDSIGGGQDNTTSSFNSTVAGGTENTANADYSSVAGGFDNLASGRESMVAGGADGVASGFNSIVLGGLDNEATGNYTVAAGVHAHADQTMCAVLSLWNFGGNGLTCLGTSNIFRIGGQHGISVEYSAQRADGGGTQWVAIGDTISGQTIGTWTGAFLTDGGTWTNMSDRAMKSDFVPIDLQQVLLKVAAMPVTSWRYNSETDQRHIGPMAQDFYAAFGVGPDERHITTVDEAGVALAAIQGLKAEVDADEAVIKAKDARVNELEQRIAKLEAMMAH